MNEKKNSVIYKNEINEVPFRKFNAKEFDLFFSICSKIKNRGTSEISLSFEELKDLSDYRITAKKHFIDDLEKVYDKLLNLKHKFSTTDTIVKFVLFTTYTIDKSKEFITIELNPRFTYLLNNMTENFTRWELEEMTSLRSSYSKTAYRLLKQYKRTGYYVLSIEKFRELFDIPESYQMYNIDQRVLEPIRKELSPLFPNLRINKIRGKGKDKRKVEKIDFRFNSQVEVDEKGNILYRNETGEYYKNHISNLEDNEIKKSFPKNNPISDQIEQLNFNFEEYLKGLENKE